MLLQTNSYIVPKEKRAEHSRLLRRFRQALGRLGCDDFEIYEQVSANWSGSDGNGRFVQIMKFRDRQHQMQIQQAKRDDPSAQALIREFCELINFPYQQQQGLFAVGYYTNVFSTTPAREYGQPPSAPPAPGPRQASPAGGQPPRANSAAAQAFVSESHIDDHPPAGTNPYPDEPTAEPESHAAHAADLPAEPIEPPRLDQWISDAALHVDPARVAAAQIDQISDLENPGPADGELALGTEEPLEDDLLSAVEDPPEELHENGEALMEDDAPLRRDSVQTDSEPAGNGSHLAEAHADLLDLHAVRKELHGEEEPPAAPLMPIRRRAITPTRRFWTTTLRSKRFPHPKPVQSKGKLAGPTMS